MILWQETEEWYGKKYTAYCNDLKAEIYDGISSNEQFPISYIIYEPNHHLPMSTVSSVEEAKRQCEMIITPIQEAA